MSPEISIRVSEAGRRYEAVLRISEVLSACRETEDLTRILSEQLHEFLDFFQFYIIVYKENSTEIEWAVVGSEKSLISAYADVPGRRAAIMAGKRYTGNVPHCRFGCR